MAHLCGLLEGCWINADAIRSEEDRAIRVPLCWPSVKIELRGFRAQEGAPLHPAGDLLISQYDEFEVDARGAPSGWCPVDGVEIDATELRISALGLIRATGPSTRFTFEPAGVVRADDSPFPETESLGRTRRTVYGRDLQGRYARARECAVVLATSEVCFDRAPE